MSDTEKFTSKYRKADSSRFGRDRPERRRVFEDGSTVDRDPPTSRFSSSSSSSRFGRNTATKDNNERSESPTSETVSRMNRMNLSDDKDNSDKEDKNDKNEDEDEEEEVKEKKSYKKGAGAHGGASGTSSRKRQARKNLREKRRSTGVVIMPGQQPGQIAPADEEERQVQENTWKNMDGETSDAPASVASSVESGDTDTLLKQLEAYEKAIEEWKDAFEKSQKEIDTLRTDNMRLKDENSALLRVVSSLSGTGGHGGHHRR